MTKKVLVINPFGIGDAIFSMELVEALKMSLPQVSVGFLGNERTITLLRMNAHIDVCHEFNRDVLRAERRKNPIAYMARAWRQLQEIRKEGYDTAFDLSLGREFSFAAFLAGIPRRIGFNYKERGFFLTKRLSLDSYEGVPVADRQLSLLRLIGIEPPPVPSKLPLKISPDAQVRAARLLTAQGVDVSRGFFAVAPGGGKSWGEAASFKQWAPERFGKAAEAWSKKTGLSVLFIGDGGETALLSEAKRSVSAPSAMIAGEDLETAAALLQNAKFLLCNDGGLLHLANALGVKTVSIYGPVDEKTYGPYGQDTPHAVLIEPVPCRPCYKNFYFPPCPHARRCLDELSVEKVLVAMQQIS